MGQTPYRFQSNAEESRYIHVIQRSTMLAELCCARLPDCYQNLFSTQEGRVRIQCSSYVQIEMNAVFNRSSMIDDRSQETNLSKSSQFISTQSSPLGHRYSPCRWTGIVPQTPSRTQVVARP